MILFLPHIQSCIYRMSFGSMIWTLNSHYVTIVTRTIDEHPDNITLLVAKDFPQTLTTTSFSMVYIQFLKIVFLLTMTTTKYAISNFSLCT